MWHDMQDGMRISPLYLFPPVLALLQFSLLLSPSVKVSPYLQSAPPGAEPAGSRHNFCICHA